LQRGFSTFPDGLPGAGLLLLRGAAGIALLVQGAAYFVDRYDVGFSSLAVGLMTVAISLLLLIGYLTPLAGVLTGLFCVGSVFSWFPVAGLELFGAKLSAALAAVIAVALVCLGPGAFSLDARLFGRREIIIPRGSSSVKF
jgi:uncharacterized membrane protein YphA (DoxX/SURF4 family)